MKQNFQRGFTSVEALVILAVVIALGGAGYFVWQSQQTATKAVNLSNTVSPSIEYTTYTDSAKVFTLKYPSDWKITLDMPDGEGAAPDWST